LLLQVISLWINTLLSDVVIIIIKLTQMTSAATMLIRWAAPIVGQSNAGLAGCSVRSVAGKKTVSDFMFGSMNGGCRRGLNNSLQEMQWKAFHAIAMTVVTVLARQMLAQSRTVILHALWKQRRGNEWSCFIHIGWRIYYFFCF
jgi:hypothetical protein